MLSQAARRNQASGDLAREPVKLGAAEISCVLLGIEQADPQPGCPRHVQLARGPASTGRVLVGAEEAGYLACGCCFTRSSCGGPPASRLSRSTASGWTGHVRSLTKAPPGLVALVDYLYERSYCDGEIAATVPAARSGSVSIRKSCGRAASNIQAIQQRDAGAGVITGPPRDAVVAAEVS